MKFVGILALFCSFSAYGLTVKAGKYNLVIGEFHRLVRLTVERGDGADFENDHFDRAWSACGSDRFYFEKYEEFQTARRCMLRAGFTMLEK